MDHDQFIDNAMIFLKMVHLLGLGRITITKKGLQFFFESLNMEKLIPYIECGVCIFPKNLAKVEITFLHID